METFKPRYNNLFGDISLRIKLEQNITLCAMTMLLSNGRFKSFNFITVTFAMRKDNRVHKCQVKIATFTKIGTEVSQILILCRN